jgi:aminoglycoside phosphotransferase (APT) family kinase protein
MPRAPRLLSTLLVVAALSTSAVFSLEARHGATTPRPRASSVKVTGSVLPDFWKTLTRLWGEIGKPPLPTLDNGCGLDPYGTCSH